jgi:hypothetical protein
VCVPVRKQRTQTLAHARTCAPIHTQLPHPPTLRTRTSAQGLLVQMDGEHRVGPTGVGVHVCAGRRPDLGPVRQAPRHVLQAAHSHQGQPGGHVVAVTVPLQLVALGRGLAVQEQVVNLVCVCVQDTGRSWGQI